MVTTIEAEAIEIDPQTQVVNDDGSSFADFTDELNSFTTSVTGSISKYPFENGRRYHAFKSGTYPLPNDELEAERMNVVHHMLKKAIGDRLFVAPVPEPHRILDVGTGTGIWAIEMGDAHPQAEILGNDLSPIQPSWVPPNVRFEVDDFESDWAFSTPFDFIFLRTLYFSVADWPRLVKQAYNGVKPGGWVEFQELDLQYYSEDGSFKDSSAMAGWLKILLDSSRNAGRDPCPGPKVEGWVKEAGFRNVVHQKIKVPIGPWAKEKRQKDIGLFNLVQTLDGLEGFSMRLFTNVLGWRPEEVEVMCSKVRVELKSKSNHVMYDLHVVYAQKPE
ncbi:S-adenosyl-L-methionine-dependent methyltransferase [Clohesyomyces aquaticus]|uniref:S-adenosyl-L-methionine-dependent methyltransferase n=1 Tax=Clohesyomyces aquaticus TaxID=1231657 RepID=A0A1Y1ZLV2_9PLEO|nr:S-adenosyl-L-methionine-dependent methyltransferase [Clohesyomyces aquaticus]